MYVFIKCFNGLITVMSEIINILIIYNKIRFGLKYCKGIENDLKFNKVKFDDFS